MSIPHIVRRPPLGPHGRKVIAGLCSWEIAALVPGSPVPTISATVRKCPPFGWVLLALLSHHWFIELEHAVGTAVGDIEHAVGDLIFGPESN